MAAEELLEQDDARELVGQGERPERQAVVGVRELEAERPPDDEADVAPGLPALLEEAAEGERVERLAPAVEEGDEGAGGDAPLHVLVLADLDDVHPCVAREELAVVLGVVDVGRALPSHGEDEVPHLCDHSPGMADDEQLPDRHINIHFSPELMAGVYANFANVSFSDYEFTITFARVDHEVEEEEIPGVVVTRVNLAPRFVRELADALEDAWSKWSTREGIKNLPEYGDQPPPAA